MRRALEELDQNTPIAIRRSPRTCVARVVEETPTRARTEPVDSDEPQTTLRQRNLAALDRAEALLREHNSDSPRSNDSNHLTYKQALEAVGYEGNHGVVVLSMRLGATRRREEADAAADALVDMSQPLVNEDEIIEGGGDGVEERPNPRPAGRKGNSGRRRMTEEEQELAALARRSVHGYKTFADYATAVSESVSLIRLATEGNKRELARKLVTERFSRLGAAAISPKHLVALSSDGDWTELQRRGGPLFTTDEEVHLANTVRKKRAHFMAIRAKDVMRQANEILRRDPERWAMTAGEGVTKGWYTRFAGRQGFKIVSKKHMEAVRLRWSTAKNAEKFYDVVASGMISLRVAEACPGVTLEIEGASQLTMLYPGLVASMDETSVSLAPDVTKTNAQRVISADVRDNGETLNAKSLPNNTLVYARNGAGQLLPSMVVCGGRKKLPNDWQHVDLLAPTIPRSEDDDHPIVDFPPNVSFEGVPLPTFWTANKTASLNSALLLDWAKQCLFPAFRVHGLCKERPGVLIVDGCQTHVSLEFVELCLENHVYIFLRPPNTTAVMQGEDTVIFP